MPRPPSTGNSIPSPRSSIGLRRPCGSICTSRRCTACASPAISMNATGGSRPRRNAGSSSPRAPRIASSPASARREAQMLPNESARERYLAPIRADIERTLAEPAAAPYYEALLTFLLETATRRRSIGGLIWHPNRRWEARERRAERARKLARRARTRLARDCCWSAAARGRLEPRDRGDHGACDERAADNRERDRSKSDDRTGSAARVVPGWPTSTTGRSFRLTSRSCGRSTPSSRTPASTTSITTGSGAARCIDTSRPASARSIAGSTTTAWHRAPRRSDQLL